MKFLKLFFLTLFLCIAFVKCNNNKTSVDSIKKVDRVNSNKKKKEKIIKKDWDSLNKKNARVFLSKYGKENKETKVLIKTEFGNIKLRLYEDTPIHRASFIFLAKIGYFDNTVFYRVVKNFVVQGGDSEDFKKSKMRYKYENYKLSPEFRKNRIHKYGAIAAAREWEYNPSKSSTPFEFYIVHNRNGAHHLNNEHTVFGEVISGFSTIDKIASVEIGPGEWPIDDVFFQVEVLE